MKKISFITIGILLIIQFSYSNEKINNLVKSKLSFVQKENGFFFNVNNFSLGADANKKMKCFTAMAIAGTVLVGVSWLFIIPGIALIPYGWDTRYTHTYYMSYGSRVHEIYEDLTLVYVGAGVLTLGLIILFTGLPLMIVGWIMRARYKNKISLLLDSYNNNTRLGIAVKL